MAPPCAEVDLDHLVERLVHGNTWKQVCGALGISISTGKRILRHLGLQRKDLIMGGTVLDSVTAGLSATYPSWGRRMIRGHLASLGFQVPTNAIRMSLQRSQPDLLALRRRRRLRRRTYYSVRAMQTLHIDGNHNLIEWKFVLYGAIDGYSRMVLMCDVVDNNRSTTLYNCFKRILLDYGVPERVRSDKGGENVVVCDAMLFLGNNDRSRYLTGRSVHNQRIERLWVDINHVTNKIKDEFLELEDEGYLHRDCPKEILALHLIYRPAVACRLKEFVSAWNLHKLSGTGGKSPEDLFFGSLESRTAPLQHVMPSILDTFEEQHSAFVGEDLTSVFATPVGLLEDVQILLQEVGEGRLLLKEAYKSLRALCLVNN